FGIRYQYCRTSTYVFKCVSRAWTGLKKPFKSIRGRWNAHIGIYTLEHMRRIYSSDVRGGCFRFVPYAILNFTVPIISILYAITGFSITKLKPSGIVLKPALQGV